MIGLLLVQTPYSVEKLEKWTVGHVKTLEERMGDVERWLVDKEEHDQRKDDKDNEADSTDILSKKEGPKTEDEILELQGRIGKIGHEMAEPLSAKIKEASPPPRSASFASVESAFPGATDWPINPVIVSLQQSHIGVNS
ncbi:hypothetical protein F5050DRAFT_1716695 [Lentinula boryana]|uniref:Uncharacterized protein n=1 Tax=Lentinula boryana TaxID=40481 RepID=A0ABQ8PW90_9AGAR|nr:hypothetical protein F5050DRAFT_1716695 [Lentinula boryana]